VLCTQDEKGFSVVGIAISGSRIPGLVAFQSWDFGITKIG